jgi:CRP/FNR family cyclic AMP-dependent transcriptional regulator
MDKAVYIAKTAIQPKQTDLLEDLPPGIVEAIRVAGARQTYKAGQEIFAQGKHHGGIFLIQSGEVRTFYLAPSGREITLAYWTKGHFVGGPEIFGRGTHIWSGTAATDCEMLFLDSDALRDLILNYPQFALNIIEALVFKAKCFSEMLQLLATRPVKTLVAKLLLLLAHESGQIKGDKATIAHRYTQEELAKMIGATRQWVAAGLSQLKREKIVLVGRDHIDILSMKRLERFAEGIG